MEKTQLTRTQLLKEILAAKINEPQDKLKIQKLQQLLDKLTNNGN
jgi:hypothetical protein